ncbi:MAG: capsular polysaccharide biosynthesis protein [Deltaproteobacteria bacterium]|nr:capsular polysaccharide biosynthesis protein [Deltaproteobacteria bacterium]
MARRWGRFDSVVGWGAKPNTRRARAIANEAGVPYVALEDGFLRSVMPGVSGEAPLAIVADDLGIYYDATRPSRLERWIADGAFEARELDRAAELTSRLRSTGLSKYNHQPTLDLGPKTRRRVLVVDQTAGDQSIRLGLCSADFTTMLRAARDEHPDSEIVVKAHPDVMLGRKNGALGIEAKGVRWLTVPAHPTSLLAQVDHVYVMTSQLGFEAVLHEVPVTCFGMPWYAGWGLTDDRASVPERRGVERSLEQLVAAAYLRYARYVDPETGERCEVERVVEHLDLQRRMGEATRGEVVCVGFSLWKRGFLPAFLDGPGTRVRFAKDTDAAARLTHEGTKLVSWGTRDEVAVRALAKKRGAEHWRMEDGFLRSVGLGSDLHAPASLVLDQRGLYYDPKEPSDIEHMLANDDFSTIELERARALRRAIVATGLSKYNARRSDALVAPSDRPVALVIGQVEDDASIQRGCVDVRTNLDLLREARANAPNAHLIFKPHPDVVSGNRHGHVPEGQALELADDLAPNASLADCLELATVVHTMTSLVGFEALLRDKRVIVYGLPFYAGWGLTDDRHTHPRRGRARSLDELVAATLIRYPRYISRATGAYTTPEVIARQLVEDRDRSGIEIPPAVAHSWAGRQLRKGQNLLRYAVRASRTELERLRKERG